MMRIKGVGLSTPTVPILVTLLILASAYRAWEVAGTEPVDPAESTLQAVSAEELPAAVAVGMKKAQVRELMGAPDSTEAQNPCWGGLEVWFYPNPDEGAFLPLQIVFNEGRVVEIGR